MNATQIRNLTLAALLTLPLTSGEAQARHRHYQPTYVSPVNTYALLKAGGYGLDSIDPRADLDSGLFVGAEIGVAPNPFIEVGLSVDWFHRRDSRDHLVSVDSPYDLPIQGRVDLNGSSTDLIPLGGIVRFRFPVANGRIAPFVSGQLTYDILRLQYHEVFQQGGASILADHTDYFYGPGGTVSFGVEAQLDPRFALMFEVGAHESEPAKDLIVNGVPIRGHVVTDGEFARIGMRFGFF